MYNFFYSSVEKWPHASHALMSSEKQKSEGVIDLKPDGSSILFFLRSSTCCAKLDQFSFVQDGIFLHSGKPFMHSTSFLSFSTVAFETFPVLAPLTRALSYSFTEDH